MAIGTRPAAGSKRKPRYPSAARKAKASSRRVPSRASGLSAFDFRRVLSFDPQPVFFVPVLDRQFGITVETVVIGADLRFDPARFIAQQQMYARRRLGQLRIDRRSKRVPDPERRAAALAVMPFGRAFVAADRCIPYPERAFTFEFESVG